MVTQGNVFLSVCVPSSGFVLLYSSEDTICGLFAKKLAHSANNGLIKVVNLMVSYKAYTNVYKLNEN